MIGKKNYDYYLIRILGYLNFGSGNIMSDDIQNEGNKRDREMLNIYFTQEELCDVF